MILSPILYDGLLKERRIISFDKAIIRLISVTVNRSSQHHVFAGTELCAELFAKLALNHGTGSRETANMN